MCAEVWEGYLKRGDEKNKEGNINPKTTSFFLHSCLTGARQTLSSTESLSGIVIHTCFDSAVLLYQSLNRVYQGLHRRSHSSVCDTRQGCNLFSLLKNCKHNKKKRKSMNESIQSGYKVNNLWQRYENRHKKGKNLHPSCAFVLS